MKKSLYPPCRVFLPHTPFEGCSVQLSLIKYTYLQCIISAYHARKALHPIMLYWWYNFSNGPSPAIINDVAIYRCSSRLAPLEVRVMMDNRSLQIPSMSKARNFPIRQCIECNHWRNVVNRATNKIRENSSKTKPVSSKLQTFIENCEKIWKNY